MPVFKRIVFMFLPLVLLLCAAELAARIFTSNEDTLVVDRKRDRSPLTEPDPDLGWRLVPGLVREQDGLEIRINDDGLRSPEIGPKRPGEFRILSLGESTTFGAFVPMEATYSALLETLLAERLGRPVTVINAGVSVYSSYQSFEYLKRRGVHFEPDAVLFYHEVNDYLPTAIRGGEGMGEVGLLKTDKELYGSQLFRLNARLMSWSHFYAWYARTLARFRIERLSRGDAASPLGEIQLPDLQVARIAQRVDGSDASRRVVRSDLRPSAVGQRVSASERLAILSELAAWCAERGIVLVLIHPSYRDSVRHECVLTRFARDHGVALFESFDALHPEGVPVPEMFLDAFHPTERGHAALARGLARYGVEWGVFPERGAER